MYHDGGWEFSISRPQSLIFECGFGSSVTRADISRGLVAIIIIIIIIIRVQWVRER